MSKKLIYLVVDNHCSLCMEAIIQSSQINDTVLIIDRKLINLIEGEECDDLIWALKDVAKNWHETSEKIINKIKAGEDVSEYKDTSKIKETIDVVPYLITFGDDEDHGEVKVGSKAVDYIKSRIGDKK